MDRIALQHSILERLSLHLEKDESTRLAKYLMEDLVPTDISDEVRVDLDRAIKRLIEGEPYQYVTHRADFYGYQYYGDNAVLIPRPETEELVYQVLQYLKKSNKTNPSIIDIGTGSGCIPVTIKNE